MPRSQKARAQDKDEAEAMARFYAAGGKGSLLLEAGGETASASDHLPDVSPSPPSLEPVELQQRVDAWLESDEVVDAESGVAVAIDETESLQAVSLDTDYQRGVALIKQCKAAEKDVNNVFNAVKPVLYQAWKSVSSKQTEILGLLKAEEKRVKGLCLTFQRNQEIARKAEEDRVNKAEEERERIARQAAAATAERMGRPEEAEAILDAPSITPPVTLPREHYVPKVAGASTPKTWKATVENLDALISAVATGSVPKEVFVINDQFLQAQARSLKSSLNYPGVRVYESETMRVRG